MTTNEPAEPDHLRFAREISLRFDSDVILYSGGIEDDGADTFIKIASRKNRKTNLFLLLTTRGGSPDDAYRIAKGMQRFYNHVRLFIYGKCKSAGTLVAIGANEIILSNFGELGPLDVQLGKPDEVGGSQSGLNVQQALASLNERVIEFFKQSLLDSRRNLRLGTRASAEVATKLAVEVYSTIYRQIDPHQLGDTERSIQIADEYGERLARISKNVKKDAIGKLISGYPSHGFVIDLDEARELFKLVRVPDDTENSLGECISFLTRDQTERPDAFVLLLSPNTHVPEDEHDQGEAGVPGEGPADRQHGSGANAEAGGGDVRNDEGVSDTKAGAEASTAE